MEEGKILLIGNETDILHCGFSFPISEGGKRYPSADHYAHAMILSQLGLEEVHILELLSTPSSEVPHRARELLRENMPLGHDMNSLAHYLLTSRQSYTMLGLRARADQDKRFRQTLMETGDALLIVCDRRDSELGIGMDDEHFVAFARHKGANAEQISQWMQDNRLRPPEIGQNQLGFFLMWLRYEIKDKERSKWLSPSEITISGLSSDQDEKPIEMTISDSVIALEGIFRPLSNYYATNFEIKDSVYRSVEHYAYQRLFESLRLSSDEIMKIRTTVKPIEVEKVARRVFRNLKIEESEVEAKSSRLDRWRQSAMKYKISKNEYLQRLLLSTGRTILLETTDGDPNWCCGTNEFEFQHLLTKKYISGQLIVDWMCGRVKVPASLGHLGANKCGLLLMELREKFVSETSHRIPLAIPMPSTLRNTSNHMICFTPESVLHPFHMTEIRTSHDTEPLFSPIHIVAQAAIKYFEMNENDAQWIAEARESTECWERLQISLDQQIMPSLEKIHGWYYEERQKALKHAMHLQFEQHPQLLRVLMDTNDSLLVCCSRFSSSEAELNIGMRERDLRLLCSQVSLDTKQIVDICLRPMAFRPSFFGGNRLGFLLMELRRDFILKGFFPHQIPELPLPPDALLGSDSPLESYVPHVHFNVFDNANYLSTWANPYLLMLKKEVDSLPDGAELWAKSTVKKSPPILISHDEMSITTIFDKLLDLSSVNFENRNENETLKEVAPEIDRAIYRRLVTVLRNQIAKNEEVQRLISTRVRESSRMQDLRRTAERLCDQARENKSIPPDLLPSWAQQPQVRTALGPATLQNQAPPDPGPLPPPPAMGKIPSLLPELTGQSVTITSIRPSFDSQRGVKDRFGERQLPQRRSGALAGGSRRPLTNYNVGQRGNGQRVQRSSRGQQQPRRPISPIRSSDRRKIAPLQQQQHPTSFSIPSPGRGGDDQQHSTNEPKKIETRESDQPPAKKIKREVREEDLSEGEILSSEED